MNGRRSLRSSSSNTQLPTKAPEARPRRKKGTASVPATEAIHEESPAQDSSGSHITKPEIKPKRKKATPALEVDESLPVIVQDNLDGFRVSGPLGEMPLEILSEVLKHLEPVSLLALLRTSRFLRAFLLNRSAASAIWKSALSLAQPVPPPCPNDLALPQYANLLYGNCHHCDTTDNLQYAWLCYMRICDGCLSRYFVEVRGDRAVPSTIRRMVPSYRKHKDVHSKYSTWGGQLLCPREEYEQKVKEFGKMSRGKKTKYEEWLAQENAKLTVRRDANDALIEWEKAMDQAASENDINRRKARRDAFIKRLKGAGYETVVTRLESEAHGLLANLPGVEGVEPLTEADWETFKPQIIESLKKHKERIEKRDKFKIIAARTVKLLRPVYEYYITHHRGMEFSGPRVLQVARREPFQSLIYDTPADQELTQADFLAHLDAIPQVLESWKEEISGLLLILLGQESAQTADAGREKGKEKANALDQSVLNRATSIFKCTSCFKLLSYPFILAHDCLVDYVRYSKGDYHCDWNEEQVEAHEQASRCARAIIDALGQDPNTVTWEQLDENNQRIECIRCRTKLTKKSRNKNNRLVMNWRHAIIHELDKHAKESEKSCQTGWQALDDESLALAYAKETIDERELTCVECKLCSIQDNQVIYPPTWRKDATVAAGAKTCQEGHDLSMGLFDEWGPPAARFASGPSSVRTAEINP